MVLSCVLLRTSRGPADHFRHEEFEPGLGDAMVCFIDQGLALRIGLIMIRR